MGVGDISANVNIFDNACAMESIIDKLPLEDGDAFEVYKECYNKYLHKAHGLLYQKLKKYLKLEKPVCPRRPKQILSTACIYEINGRCTET